MHIRTFRAASLQDALAEIRQQMGSEAAVLHTRQVRDGVLGWLGKTHVEVTAGLRDENERPRVVRSITSAPISPDQRVPEQRSSAGQGIRPELAAQPIVLAQANAPGTVQLSERLAAAGVLPETARNWLERAEQAARAALGIPTTTLSPEMLETHLRRNLSHSLRIGGPVRAPLGERRVVALVGPTGVGKTTTIAKLAAGFRLQQKRRVGLLTIDTYRIAAVQQLQAYAEIMDLPMRVVDSPEQMQSGIEALNDVELVLIDTAGRSPRLAARIKQLKDLLSAASPHEIHLVVSATASAHSICSTLEGFSAVSPTATILTKLDETEQLAGVLAALESKAPPLSYLTHGQQVPDDIEPANAESVLTRFFIDPVQNKTAA